MLSPKKSVTLVELLIAIALLSIIVLTIFGLDLFSRSHLIDSERRVKLQHEVSLVLEHMSKEISRAIGNERINTQNTVVDIVEKTGDDERSRIKIYIDASQNGIREPPINNPLLAQDHWIAYRFFDNTAPPNRRYQIQFCSLCRNKPCTQCGPPGQNLWETISGNITGLNPNKPVINPGFDETLTDNFVDIQITACWDPPGPAEIDTCGNPDNPEVVMRTKIKMPSVSTH